MTYWCTIIMTNSIIFVMNWISLINLIVITKIMYDINPDPHNINFFLFNSNNLFLNL